MNSSSGGYQRVHCLVCAEPTRHVDELEEGDEWDCSNCGVTLTVESEQGSDSDPGEGSS